MKLYRIYTENKKADEILVRVHEDFDGFTFFEADGSWLGELEHALVIEIIAPEGVYDKIKGIAAWIKEHNSQEAVMVTSQPITAELV